MRRFGPLCCGGAVVYLLFCTENRGASGGSYASRPRALIGDDQGAGCDVRFRDEECDVPVRHERRRRVDARRA